LQMSTTPEAPANWMERIHWPASSAVGLNVLGCSWPEPHSEPDSVLTPKWKKTVNSWVLHSNCRTLGTDAGHSAARHGEANMTKATHQPTVRPSTPDGLLPLETAADLIVGPDKPAHTEPVVAAPWAVCPPGRRPPPSSLVRLGRTSIGQDGPKCPSASRSKMESIPLSRRPCHQRQRSSAVHLFGRAVPPSVICNRRSFARWVPQIRNQRLSVNCSPQPQSSVSGVCP